MRSGLGVGSVSHSYAQVLPPMKFLSAAAIKFEKHALALKINLGNLNRVAGICSWSAVKSHKILEVLKVQRFAHWNFEGLFASRKRLKSLRVLAIQIPNKQYSRLLLFLRRFSCRSLCWCRSGTRVRSAPGLRCGRRRLAKNISWNSHG